MINGLQPYPEYKESGSHWLGTVPSHWMVRNLRTFISRRNERNRPDLPLLSVAREKGVFVRSLTGDDENHNVIPNDLSNYKVARTGNLVINKMKAWQGSMGIAPCDGVVSPAYFVFDFRITNRAFGQALLRSKPYVAHFGQASDGVRVGQWDLSIPGMRQIPVLVPGEDEQAAIVRFLDHANRRIERAIRTKKKLIALLDEQKQVIIHRAVTRGLNPTVPFKPSGIPWLGDIPRHWDTCALKRSLIRMDYGTSENAKREGKVRVLTMGHIRNGEVMMPGEGSLHSVPPGLLLETNDLLFNRTNSPDLVGKVGLFTGEAEDQVTFASYLVRLRVRPNHNPFWLNYLLNSSRFWAFARSHALLSLHQANLNSTRYGQMSLPVPPKAEQDEIVEHIVTEARGFNLAIDRTEREISLLREYRARLVTDVVTGKLDVRAAARQLPDESDKPEATLDSEDLAEELDLEPAASEEDA
jgi:type I restriction enzyme, S subunit